jgi:hypothetical protein
MNLGRGARTRTEVTGFGGPRTSRCTTPLYGGEEGIRTLGTRGGSSVFETDRLILSRTSPSSQDVGLEPISTSLCILQTRLGLIVFQRLQQSNEVAEARGFEPLGAFTPHKFSKLAP